MHAHTAHEEQEEKAEDTEVCSNDNFDPQPGDFCLFVKKDKKTTEKLSEPEIYLN